MLDLLERLLFSTLDYAPALIFAAIGSALSERAGVVNLGAEGMMRAGAFFAAAAAVHCATGLAVLVGMVAGAALASLHGYLSIRWRSDQIVSGMALNLIMLAGATFLLESYYSPSGSPPIAQLHRWTIPGLSQIPLLRAMSWHSALTYLSIIAGVALQLLLLRTPLGLRVRAVGESPSAATAAGLSVSRLRYGCVIVAGLLCGLGGAALSTSILDRFEPRMPSGLGFMALAAMIFGRWTPLGAMGAALFFALANALRIVLLASIPEIGTVPQGFLLALPYALTLIVLTVQGAKSGAPAALGRPYDPAGNPGFTAR